MRCGLTHRLKGIGKIHGRGMVFSFLAGETFPLLLENDNYA